MRLNRINTRAFTIIELLVVIVVIGILAAISIASYVSISKQSIVASLRSDLAASVKQLKLYNVDNSLYPISITETTVGSRTYCPSGITPADVRYCIKSSPGSSFVYINPTPQSFILTAINASNAVAYRVTNDSNPVEVAPPVQITGISVTTGTTQVGSVLTAGAIAPAGASGSITYQWQRSDTSNGAYVNITGATAGMYVLAAADNGKFIKVIATGFGDYYGSIISDPSVQITPNPWIAGVAATVMENKFVRNADISGTYVYKTSNTAVAIPQGVIGLDPNYPALMSLVNPQTNPGVDFSLYSAQNACKAVGGRLPNMQELLSIYSNKVAYGGNFQAGYYTSSTENGAVLAYLVYFVSGGTSSLNKSFLYYVRCVSG